MLELHDVIDTLQEMVFRAKTCSQFKSDSSTMECRGDDDVHDWQKVNGRRDDERRDTGVNAQFILCCCGILGPQIRARCRLCGRIKRTNTITMSGWLWTFRE
jgi:hypothetical protein